MKGLAQNGVTYTRKFVLNQDLLAASDKPRHVGGERHRHVGGKSNCQHALLFFELMAFNTFATAATGQFFHVDETGTDKPLDITLCLNAWNPITCGTFSVNSFCGQTPDNPP